MEMSQFLEACNNFRQYPQNVLGSNKLQHSLKNYFLRLESNAYRLFLPEDKASLDFLDSEGGPSSFRLSTVQNLGDLKQLLREPLREEQIESVRSCKGEPMSRFVFLHARNSRAELNISHEMFLFLFSYLQVSPSFLDFVFPFGGQETAQDFYFGGFKGEVEWCMANKALTLPALGRSGCGMRLSFNLRSVEPAPRSVEFPWSIRQLAVYHMFDFRSGKSTWVTVKGNKVIKKRILALVETQSTQSISSANNFANALKIHLLLCDWSVENWRWYINDLENSLRGLTRNALSTNMDQTPHPIQRAQAMASLPPYTPTSPRSQNGFFPSVSRVGTSSTFAKPSNVHTGFSELPLRSFRADSTVSAGQTMTDENENLNDRAEDHNGSRNKVASFFRKVTPFANERKTDQGVNMKEKQLDLSECEEDRHGPQVAPPGISEGAELESAQEVKFSDLQSIQHIEGKAHEVSLVLKLNAETFRELWEQYDAIMKHQDLPAKIRDDCKNEMADFTRYVTGAQKDLRLQLARTETLLRLLAEQKAFLYGILQYQSMRSSELFAQRAHESALNMEGLTNNMNEIAQKTKQETVSMRIITLVTLFFLPGTFIATFMSTDIIKFEGDNTQQFQWKGLRLYLVICLPLMLLTFLAWFLVYKYANRERRKSDAGTSLGYADSV